MNAISHFPPSKRAFDLLLVIGSMPVWAPLLAVIALAVRWRMGSPVLFSQPRPGLGGQLFRLVKFRTMTDARDQAGRLRSDTERLVPFGRWLRSTSLDELPELLNVLRGDMSLVGPRPLLVQYLDRYTERQKRRHDVPPGLTGLAQINGRNALTWEEKFELDVRYAETRSLWLDCWILARTVAAVLRREGIDAPGQQPMPEFKPDVSCSRNS